MSQPRKPLRLRSGECRLVVVQDQLTPCPYLDGVTARMPLRLPVGSVIPAVTDELLAAGYRRSGDFLYRTQCPTCVECRPTRIDASRFEPSKSMRRVVNRANRDLSCRWGKPRVDSKRIELFNLHRETRGLGQGSNPIDGESYRSFLTDTCCDTMELAIYLNQRLVAASIVDVGQTSTSAVYTFFDPGEERYCLGTLAILRQIAWAQKTGRQYVYLGMYVAANSHLNYKSRFAPQQRLIDGNWIDFDAAGEPSSALSTQNAPPTL